MILATLKQNESMYTTTSGFVHKLVKPWTAKGRFRTNNTQSQPYPTPRSHLFSGLPVQVFKHNPQTCQEVTLEPCEGRRVQTSQGRICRSQLMYSRAN